ncbi:MAG: replication initiation protein [Psychromonas sp.]
MASEKKLTVVQHNELVLASYRLELDEMRLINLALTKIDSRKPNVGIIKIYPDEFAKMYGLSKKNIWRNMKKSVLGLMHKPIKLRMSDQQGHKKERVLAWLLEANYYVDQSDSSKLEIEFSPRIEPYLFELKGNFTKVNFEYASRLTTSFSFRLYQWLIQEHRIKRGQYYELIMTLDDIKIAAQLENAYSVWGDFKKKIIQPAVDAINQKTNLSISYSVTKQGRRVHAITFTYIDEVAKVTKSLENGEAIELSNQKPIRPRLLRRPKVTKGSHAEGEWQRANLKLLVQYQKDLKNWDNTARLTIPDLRKLIDYSRLFAHDIHNTAVKELEKRTRK